METRVLTAHVPLSLAEKVDEIATPWSVREDGS
jgi:hypothetical protein